MRTLVVVDAQYHYLSWDVNGYDKIIKNIQKMVQKWKKQNWPIIFVEFGSEKTLSDITNLVKGYNKVYTIRKDEADGSQQVSNVVFNNNLPKDLHFCGVNWNQCVQTTIFHLLINHSDISVKAYRQASNPNCFRRKFEKYHRWGHMKYIFKDKIKVY